VLLWGGAILPLATPVNDVVIVNTVPLAVLSAAISVGCTRFRQRFVASPA